MLKRRRRVTRVSAAALRGREEPSRVVAAIAPAPLLIAHGTDDWLVPADHARVLFDRAAEPKKLLLIPGGLHAEYIVTTEPDSLIAPLGLFFREGLR